MHHGLLTSFAVAHRDVVQVLGASSRLNFVRPDRSTTAALSDPFSTYPRVLDVHHLVLSIAPIFVASIVSATLRQKLHMTACSSGSLSKAFRSSNP